MVANGSHNDQGALINRDIDKVHISSVSFSSAQLNSIQFGKDSLGHPVSWEVVWVYRGDPSSGCSLPRGGTSLKPEARHGGAIDLHKERRALGKPRPNQSHLLRLQKVASGMCLEDE